MRGNQDEYQIEYWTREQAIGTAREQATRDLIESESVISYVAFVSGLSDFCRCEFHLETPHGWVQSIRMLKPEELGCPRFMYQRLPQSQPFLRPIQPRTR